MDKLNFLQLQLVEYGLFCLCEYNNIKHPDSNLNFPKLVIQSNNDVFIASSLKFDENGNLNFKTFSGSLTQGYTDHTCFVGNKHPFQSMRDKIYDEFMHKRIFATYISALDYPEVFIERLIEIAKSVELQHDFEMPKIWYNYQSLKHEKLSLDFVFIDEDEYKILSVC